MLLDELNTMARYTNWTLWHGTSTEHNGTVHQLNIMARYIDWT